MEVLDNSSDWIMEMLVNHGLGLIYGILTLVIGLWVINALMKQVKKLMVKREVDPSLVPFLSSVMSTILKVGLFITVAGMVGVEMTSFIAILGAAGLAVGMALSGTLQNFAGGVMILLFKPFKVGDFIDAQGYKGSVKSIQIFNTYLTTPDNKVVIIPNGGLSNSAMTNYSTMDTRRVDFSFGIDYGDNFKKAKEVLMSLIEADNRILKDPAPFVRLGELGDSSVNMTVRVWVNSEDYWNVHFDMMENVKERFDAEGLNFPFPQMDVHLDK